MNALPRIRAALWRRSPHQPGQTGPIPVLEGVVADLRNLNRTTERDFLTVGEKLMEFHSSARRISSDMTVLTGLIAGEQGRDAATALDRVLSHSIAIQARTRDRGQILETVRDRAARLRHAFTGLPNTVSTFRTLCTLTRIETARLGSASAEFTDLAEEVRPLSESIQSSGAAMLDSAAALDRGVAAALRSANGLQTRQLRELPLLMETVTGSLKVFAGKQQKAAEASAVQAAQYDGLCAAVDGLVRSIQFHDITRQQIEHVVEALERIPSGEAPCKRSLLTLQSSQLRSAAGVFASAVQGITRDLEEVAARLRGMADSSRSLLDGGEHEHDSFFLRMEGSFAGILRALAACTEADAEMQATAEAVETMVQGMRESVAQIRSVEIRIQRIALNAAIRASHIGADGDPLSVIAGVLQQMVSASSGNTEEAAGALDAISEAVRRLSTAPAASNTVSESSEQMRHAILEMHSAGELSYTRVNQIAALGASLAAGISELSEGFSAGTLVAEVLARCCAELERVAAELPVADAGAPSNLDQLAEGYTMQTEREVHRMALHGEPAPQSEEALGDNVELF